MRVVPSGSRKSSIRSFLEHIAIPTICVLLVCLFTGLFFSKLTAEGTYLSDVSYNGFWCQADGDIVFPWQDSGNVYWEPELFLSITLAFGSLTFSQAKAIDVIWDLVVGRGGQLLLTVLAYPVLRKSFLAHMEAQSMRMPVLASLVFEHGSCWSWWAVTKELTRKWSWRLFAYLWVIMYLLAFGTLVSAMTGYQSVMSPYYSGGQDSLTSFSKVQSVSGALLVDGDRIGLDSHTLVIDWDKDPNYPLFNYSRAWDDNCKVGYLEDYTNDNNGTLTDPTGSFSIQWSRNSSESSSYRSKIECTTSNVTLKGQTYSLEAPPLSFEAPYNGGPYYNPSISPSSYSSSSSEVIIDSEGNILERQWLKDNSQCQILTKYQWGFSSLLLFCCCLASILYACILLALHIDVWFCSQSDRMHMKFSIYRDVLDVAEEIRSILGDKVNDMPARELKKHPALQDAQVSACAYDHPSSRQQALRARKGSFSRIKAELRAGHEYSMGELKRSLGIQYGPIPPPKVSRQDTADVQSDSEA